LAQVQHISLAKLVVEVGAMSRSRVWTIVGMWPDRPIVVPNMVVLYDDIIAFVSVFGQFSINKPVKLFYS
jgi:hypothetical protein